MSKSKTPSPPAKSAVVYARYSSENQRDVSIEQQVDDIQEFSRREGYVITKVYADRHITGKKEERPQFQKLMRDSAKGNFGTVLIWKTDRFARNRYDSATYKYRLRQNGVKVVSAMENIPDTPEGIMLESVLEGQAEYYSASLAQNVKRGQGYNAQRCMVNGIRAFGYRAVDGHWQIDEEEAKIVRQMFDWCINGVGGSEIAKRLNMMGIKTLRGNEWVSASVRQFLANEKYCGVYKFGDTRIEGGVPAIIDRATFDAAQAAIKRRRCSGLHARPVGGVQRYLLTGHIVCGVCGRAMHGCTSGPGKWATHYYHCGGRNSGAICDMPMIRADQLEPAVLDAIQNEILQPDRANAIVDAMIRAHKPAESAAVIEGLQAQLKDRIQAINNILKAIESGAWSPALNDRLADLEREKLEIEAAIREAEGAKEELSREDLLATLARFATGDLSDRDYCLRLINTMVDRITVYPDKTFKIEIRFDGSQDTGHAKFYAPREGSSEECAPSESLPGLTSSTRIIVTAGLVTILGQLRR